MGCCSTKLFAADAQPEAEFFDRYDLSDVLGQGAYATVRLAYSVESQERCAVKILDMGGRKKQPTWPMYRQVRIDVRREQQAWARIGSHPNIVGFRDFFIGHNFAYFVMELCTSSLFTAWMSEPHLNEYTYAQYFKGMAQALKHIHSVGVVHRDVKQDNLMVGPPDGRTIKLCDFGLSAVVVGGDTLSGQYGTAPYMAPEMANYNATHGPPADVWSFGVIVYTAFFGCWPYQPRRRSRGEMLSLIRDGTIPPNFAPPRRFSRKLVSEVGIDFVNALLDRSPITRPSAASCLEMTYLTRRCNQLQADRKSNWSISLTPQLHAAKKCGAFNLRTPEADASEERQLMRLQNFAQLRRAMRRSKSKETNISLANASVLGEHSMLQQQGQSLNEDVGRRAARSSKRRAQTLPKPATHGRALLTKQQVLFMSFDGVAGPRPECAPVECLENVVPGARHCVCMADILISL